MKKISVIEGMPEYGEKVLCKGIWCGEIYGKDECADWYFCEYKGGTKFNVIGCDYYSTWVENVTHWIKLDLNNL